MLKLLAFLTFAFTLTSQVYSQTCHSSSNDSYYLVIGDYTSTNHAEEITPQPPLNTRIWFLNQENTWVHSNQSLPDLEGTRASPWYFFANTLASKTKGNLWIAVLAYDDARVDDWTDIGNPNSYWERINKSLSAFPKDTTVNVLWMVGENDADDLSAKLPRHYQEKSYSASLLKLIDWSPECYSWGVALTSYSPFNDVDSQNYIRQEEATLVNNFGNRSRVWGGPDTDQICHSYRYKNIYYNTEGSNLLSLDWISSLEERKTSLNPTVNYCDYYLISIDLFFWNVVRFVVIGFFIFLIAAGFFACCQVFRGRTTTQEAFLPKYVYESSDKPPETKPLISSKF